MGDREAYHHGDLERALVDQAFAMVRDAGAERFSLRAAARAVGVDPAAAYRHFPSKAALMARVAGRAFEDLAARMGAGIVAADDPEARLRATGHAYVRFALDEPALFRLAFGAHGSGSADPAARGENTAGRSPYELLLDVLAELHAAGLVRHPPARAAVSAWCTVHGLATLAISGSLECDPIEIVVDQVLDDLLGGLRG